MSQKVRAHGQFLIYLARSLVFPEKYRAHTEGDTNKSPHSVRYH